MGVAANDGSLKVNSVDVAVVAAVFDDLSGALVGLSLTMIAE